jgi:hypothetical protein
MAKQSWFTEHKTTILWATAVVSLVICIYQTYQLNAAKAQLAQLTEKASLQKTIIAKLEKQNQGTSKTSDQHFSPASWSSDPISHTNELK